MRTEVGERWWLFRKWMCGKGWHWPIRWSESAYPGSYDPPHPPEPGFACDWCGATSRHPQDRYPIEPYRSWWWEWKRLGYLALHGEWSER
jgi:hypothetical protein